MIQEKKAMFFTITAITLLTLLGISMTIISLSEKRDSVNKRITTLNNYVIALEEDMPRKLYISSFRILFLLERRIVENGEYISDVETLMEEAFFNATINGIANEEETQLLTGITYNDIITDLLTEAQKLNLDLTLNNPEFFVDQEDPWNLHVQLNVDLYLEDKGGLASWNRTLQIEEYIPTKNFEDPIYLINTNGLIGPKIRQTPYTKLIGPNNETTNLSAHIKNQYYIATNESPSFINRLEGNLSANTQGIESLIYIPELTNNGITILDKSIVDHIYFSNNNPTTKTLNNMSNWFKIDNEHEQHYNVTGLTV